MIATKNPYLIIVLVNLVLSHQISRNTIKQHMSALKLMLEHLSLV